MGLLVNVTALIHEEYHSFSTEVAFDENNPAEMYRNLANFIFNNYLVL